MRPPRDPFAERRFVVTPSRQERPGSMAAGHCPTHAGRREQALADPASILMSLGTHAISFYEHSKPASLVRSAVSLRNTPPRPHGLVTLLARAQFGVRS